VIEYGFPHREHVERTIKAKLAGIRKARVNWKQLAKLAEGLSYADITRACEEAIKDVIIHARETLCTKDVVQPLVERKAIQRK
jgi:ATP-dependent 26S proteasome regulatory subunit